MNLIHSCGGNPVIDPKYKSKVEPALNGVESDDILRPIMCEKCGDHLGFLANVDQIGDLKRAS